MRPVILLDVDGVCCDFVQPIVNKVNTLTGSHHTPTDINQWEMMDAFNATPQTRKAVDNMVKTKGFCRGLKAYDGALEGVNALRNFATVHPVTAPYDSDFWIAEREQWLVQELGFSRHDIAYTHAKHLIMGDVLIDDKTSTLVKWQTARGPKAKAVLFSQPWNVNDAWGGIRVTSWLHLVTMLRFHFVR